MNYRRQVRNGAIRAPPLYPPSFLSVFENVELGIPRTQNRVEGWHRRWETLVGAKKGVYNLISEMVKEQKQTDIRVARSVSSVVATPPKKDTEKREKGLRAIFEDRDNRDVLDYLHAIANHMQY